MLGRPEQQPMYNVQYTYNSTHRLHIAIPPGDMRQRGYIRIIQPTACGCSLIVSNTIIRSLYFIPVCS